MGRTIGLSVLSVALVATGLSCAAGVPLPTTVELDRAICVMEIVETDGQALVRAVIADSSGQPVQLSSDQSVLVNDQPLAVGEDLGTYGADIAMADTYTVTVSEPSRGVEDTDIDAPTTFVILAPEAGQTVSLAGFTVETSQTDAALEAEIGLTQTILDTEHATTLGPFTDTGSWALSAEDLADFQQGAALGLTVTKIRRAAAINGFAAATLSVLRGASVSVQPGS